MDKIKLDNSTDNLCIAVIEQCIKDYYRGDNDEKKRIESFLRDNIFIDTIASSSGKDPTMLSDYIISKLKS